METHKIIVEFDGIEYEVEIHPTAGDILEVVVNGQTHRVSIKALQQPGSEKAAPKAEVRPASPRVQPEAASPQVSGIQADLVTAPMPGDIQSIAVKVGDRVSVGQELVVLEAMKMKNVIRSPQAGRVSAVDVSVGQSVKFGDPLVRFG